MLRRGAGTTNDYLEILLYRNRLQLATANALYSDGDRYTPAITTVKAIKEYLPYMKHVLVLGAGLGSIIRVMAAKGYKPHCTLVELDKTVLGWALELLGEEYAQNIEPVCADAHTFMGQNREKYDLIFIDIFDSMVVPAFVTTTEFLAQCRDSLSPGGCVALNYIINDKQEWGNIQHVFTEIFPGGIIENIGVNRILLHIPKA